MRTNRQQGRTRTLNDHPEHQDNLKKVLLSTCFLAYTGVYYSIRRQNDADRTSIARIIKRS